MLRRKLLEARKEAGFTHEKIAQELGISRAHYTHIELGTRNPSLELAVEIARLLNKSLDEIFLPEEVSKRDTDITENASQAG
jgi:putative transcriptional regulator